MSITNFFSKNNQEKTLTPIQIDLLTPLELSIYNRLKDELKGFSKQDFESLIESLILKHAQIMYDLKHAQIMYEKMRDYVQKTVSYHVQNPVTEQVTKALSQK